MYGLKLVYSANEKINKNDIVFELPLDFTITFYI